MLLHVGLCLGPNCLDGNQVRAIPMLGTTVGSVERVRRVRNMRGRICAAIIVDPGPRRGSVHSFERIGPFTTMLPNCAEIAQHPLLILQSLR
jgi:hypothetical protein